MIKAWIWLKKYVLSPIKLSGIAGGIVFISNESGNQNPYYVFVPLCIILAAGYISLMEDAIVSARKGEPLKLL